MTNNAKICQLKIKLNGSRPTIWRRVQVPGDITLAKLHRVIQAVMGWYDSHLHQFIVGKTYYGVPSLDEFSELDLKDERKVRLGQILSNPKQKMVYEYDFGDGWEHDIALEKIFPPDSNTRYPVCLEGACACLPEDCGGVGGYENFLDAIRDPDQEEHDEYLEWIGGEFDPEEFAIVLANRELKRIKKRCNGEGYVRRNGAEIPRDSSGALWRRASEDGLLHARRRAGLGESLYPERDPSQ